MVCLVFLAEMVSCPSNPLNKKAWTVNHNKSVFGTKLLAEDGGGWGGGDDALLLSNERIYREIQSVDSCIPSCSQ